MAIYENILEIAEKKKISISQLERDSGIAKGTISKWKTSSPSVINLKSVADNLGVTVNRLIKE